jgi:hypothetical protein
MKYHEGAVRGTILRENSWITADGKKMAYHKKPEGC